jgi:transcription elongation factor GreA
MSKIKFTKEGLEDYKKELEVLENSRKGAVDELKVAREMGDLSENAAYKVARQKLSRTDSRIRYLNKVISNSEVVVKRCSDRVEIGSQIIVECDGIKYDYQIVGGHEVNLSKNKISFFSPLGSAFLNCKILDIINVNTPSGVRKYIIHSIL